MPERRGSRFVVEALFLVALTVALALAHLDPIEIVGAMGLGWVVIAAIEWAAWRSEPHFGSGMPPRYFLPRVDLPPPQPLEQVVQGYPGSGRDDAPTWIASAALRSELLGDWPVPGPPAQADRAPDGPAEPARPAPPRVEPDPWTVASLPAEPLPAAAAAASRPPVQAPAAARVARYSYDPLGAPPPRRRFGLRATGEGSGTIDVPSRPTEARPLPHGLSS